MIMIGVLQQPGNPLRGIMTSDLWYFEQQAWQKGFIRISGIDEVGRGPLAGPVVSAAVILPESCSLSGIGDSKTLSPKQRDRLYDRIYDQAISIGIGIVDAGEIDRINILQASLLSMRFAMNNLSPQPDYLLIDGKFPIRADIAQKAVIKGDSLSISIAAASIVAKVTRDRLMDEYHEYYPQFGFAFHKGYPTKTHKEAIRQFGICPIHRKTFRGVKEYVCQISEFR